MRLSLSLSLSTCIVLFFAAFCPGLTAQDEGSAQISEAEAREKAVVDRFWSLLERTPRRGTSLDRVYGYYVDTGQMEQLIEKCVALTEEKPDDGKAWLLLGLVLSRRNDDEGTINALQKAEQLDTQDALASFYLGEALIAQGRLREAAAALERSVERKPQRNDMLAVMQTLGRVYERFADKEKSEQLWSRMEELFPNDPDILVRIAETLEEEGKYDDALSRYQKLAELSRAPCDFNLLLAYAEMLTQSGDYDAAMERVAIMSTLFETDDEPQALSRVQIELLTASGKLRNWIEKWPQFPTETLDARELWRRAMFYRADGALNDATTAIEKALKLEPNRLLLLDTAADIYTKNYDEQRAAAIYEKLASVDSARRVEHLKRLANLQRDMGQTDKAIETARLVMATGSGNTANSRFYADMLIGIGRRADGIEALRRAVRIDPTDQVSLAALAEQLSQGRQLDEAIEIVWRIFDRTDDLQGKIGQIGKLSGYYQQGNRFDQLIARLRQSTTEPGKRRVSVHEKKYTN